MYSFLFGLYLVASFAVGEAEQEIEIPVPPYGKLAFSIILILLREG